jgi:hypothetical protein
VHEHEDSELIYEGNLLILNNVFNAKLSAKLSEGNKKEKKNYKWSITPLGMEKEAFLTKLKN